MGYGQKVLRILLVVASLIVVWSGFMSRGWANQAPLSCKWCHPKAESTWSRSVHAKFQCSACHTDLEWLGMFGRKLVGTKDQIPAKVAKEVCLSCHSLRRKETVPGELLVPHQLHDQKTVECLDCHANPGHTKRKVKAAASVSMDKCYDCHNGSLAPKECRACHKYIQEDPAHARPNWLTEHGAVALKNFTCQQCHNSTTEELVYQRELSNNFARARHLSLNTPSCLGCHRQRPDTHTQSFRWEHGSRSLSKEGCYICHPNDGEPANLLPAKVECNQCHGKDKHSAGWRSQHPRIVGEQGSTNCYRCHAPASCGSCHLGRR